jgi:hypothetical protein
MAALTVGIAWLSAIPLVAEDSCQPVLDAMNRIYTTRTHLYTTMDGNYKNELIYADGVVYDNLHGKWSRSSVTLQRVKELEENNRQNSKYTCRYLRDESVNGEMAAVYSTQASRSDLNIKSDGRLWISKTKGLVLRHEEDIEGDGVKNHHSTRYEYANVQPPRL